MRNINSTTPIHDFPEIYNSNNEELLETIENLKSELEEVKKDRDNLKQELVNKFNILYAKLIKDIDQKMSS